MTHHTIKPWDIQYLDSFTLHKIWNMVSDLELKLWGDGINNKSDYDKGKDMAYRTIMGELSGLIELKKTVDKINKQRQKKQKGMKENDVL